MATNPRTTNLIAWWSLNETSGTRADSHGTNHLSDNNTVGYAAGIKDNAADFEEANSEYLSIADNPDLSFGDEDMTVCAWVKLESKPGTHALNITQKGLSTIAGSEWELIWLHTTDRFRWGVSNGSTVGQVAATTFGAPSLGVWYFLVAQHDSVNNLIKISVNTGLFDTSVHSVGIQDGSSDMHVGHNPGGIGYFDGLIDEVSLWSNVLTQDEIDWLYNGGAGRRYVELLKPHPAVIPLVLGVYGPGVRRYDTRIKLRGRARDVHLTTKVRNQQ